MSASIAPPVLPGRVCTVIVTTRYKGALVVVLRAEGVPAKTREMFTILRDDDLAMPIRADADDSDGGGELVVGLYEITDVVVCRGRIQFHKADAVDILRRHFGLNAKQAVGCLLPSRLEKLYRERKTMSGREPDA